MPRKTFVAGDVFSAADANLLAQDGYVTNASLDTTAGELGGAWTTWTPVVTQSNAVTVTVTSATYARFGRLIIARAKLVATAAGTAANHITISVPVTAAVGSFTACGIFWWYDASTSTHYTGSAHLDGTTYILGIASGATGGMGFNTPNLALANNDELSFTIVYEAAS